MHQSQHQRVLILIFIASVIRLVAASSIELGNDEAYYWTYSQHLQWNYFDHPPMVAIWIRLFTGNLILQQYELFLRLGSIVSCAISTWLMYRTCSILHSERAGWLAACLYTTSIYASIISGVFIMPDSPQMVFWCSCLFLIVKICRDKTNWLYWIFFGISAGLCIMSKVHGIFIWFGMGLFILSNKRDWLRLKQLYAAVILTIVIVSPILFWNINNHFISYSFHSARIIVHQFTFNTNGFITEIFGQIFYNNPLNFILIVLAFISWRKRKIVRLEPLSIYQFIALPMIAILLLIAMFRNTLPHWSGPAYVTLLPLAAIYFTSVSGSRFFPISLRWGIGIIAVTLIAGIAVIDFYPGTIGKKSNQDLGDGDPTLDMYGWKNAGESFARIYRNDVNSGIMPTGSPIVCYKWFPAAHEDYYFCHPLGIQMIGLGSVFDLHEYAWMNDLRKNHVDFNKAYCVVPSNENYDARRKYLDYYSQVNLVTQIENFRNKKLSRYFYVYRLQGWKNKIL